MNSHAFGLRNAAGANCVRDVTSLLQPLRSYVDNNAVGSQTWWHHMSHFRQFLFVIKAAGMTLSLSKSEFAKPEVKMLGHLIGSGIKNGGRQRLTVIAEMPRPSTKRQLRRLLGALGYYQEYTVSQKTPTFFI